MERDDRTSQEATAKQLATWLDLIINRCHSEPKPGQEALNLEGVTKELCRIIERSVDAGTLPNFRELKAALEPFGVNL